MPDTQPTSLPTTRNSLRQQDNNHSRLRLRQQLKYQRYDSLGRRKSVQEHSRASDGAHEGVESGATVESNSLPNSKADDIVQSSSLGSEDCLEDVSLKEKTDNCEAAAETSTTSKCRDVPEPPRLALTRYHNFPGGKPAVDPPDYSNETDKTCDTLVEREESVRESTSPKSKKQTCDNSVNVRVVQETPLFSGDLVVGSGPAEEIAGALVVKVPLLKSQRITTKCVGETPLVIGVNECTAEGEVSAVKERMDFNCPVPNPHTPSGSPSSPARLRYTSSTTDSDRTISLPPSPPSTLSHTVTTLTTQSPLYHHTPLTSSTSSTTPDLQPPSSSTTPDLQPPSSSTSPDLQLHSSSTSPSLSPSLFITRQKSLGGPFSSKYPCPALETDTHTVSPPQPDTSLSPCIPLQNDREKREQSTRNITPDFLTSKIEETQLSVVSSSQKSPPASTAERLMTALMLPRVVSRDPILPAGRPQGVPTSPRPVEAVSVIPDSQCPSPPFLETCIAPVTEPCSSPAHISNISSVLQGLTPSSRDLEVFDIQMEQKRCEMEELEEPLVREEDVLGGTLRRETTPTQGEIQHEVVTIPESISNYTPPDHAPLPPDQTSPSFISASQQPREQITEVLTPESVGRVEVEYPYNNPPGRPPSKNTPSSCPPSKHNPPSLPHKTRHAVSPTLLKGQADRLLKTLRKRPVAITDKPTTIDVDCDLLTLKTSQPPFSHHSNVCSTHAKSHSISLISRHCALSKTKQLENQDYKGKRKTTSLPRKPFSIKNTANDNSHCPITASHIRHTHKSRKKKDKTTRVINLGSADVETETCHQMTPLPEDHPFMSISTAPLNGSCGKWTSELAP